METKHVAKTISCKLFGLTLCLSTLCFSSTYAECTGLQDLGQSSNGHALAFTCKLSNLHPVLAQSCLSYSVSSEIILSVLYICSVLFTASVYLLLYHVSSPSPNLPLAVQLGLFMYLQNLPGSYIMYSWYLGTCIHKGV